jgi:hypothetical protein
MRWFTALLLALVLCTAMPLSASACPYCRLSLQDDDAAAQAGGAPGNMSAGYAYSIYLMLLVPAALTTGLVFFIRRQTRDVPPQPPEG